LRTVAQIKPSIRSLLVLALVLAACSPAGFDAAATAGERGVGTTTAPAGSTTTSAKSDVIVMEKATALEAAMPDGWTAMTGPVANT